MDKIVCSRDNRACMLHCYTDCPNNSESLKSYLSYLLKDYDDEEEIQFSQWIHEGRMKLQTMTLPVGRVQRVGVESSAILQRLEPSLHNYVACVYEESWWFELVSELNKEGYYIIAFMHPHGPSETFYWPERQDECPVPSQHVLCV
ncbi:hypothetical protein AVEN_142769-1 [Araneus ventricosus]|uniref:Uncharacterized protein n=1 Tax=Araneus ventricosus TaxID=182803 RepID=A0A4Y2D1L4_ARAVE|nr:hypothetical protein AVEN_142769-1 [Araneus ventricosus]